MVWNLGCVLRGRQSPHTGREKQRPREVEMTGWLHVYSTSCLFGCKQLLPSSLRLSCDQAAYRWFQEVGTTWRRAFSALSLRPGGLVRTCSLVASCVGMWFPAQPRPSRRGKGFSTCSVIPGLPGAPAQHRCPRQIPLYPVLWICSACAQAQGPLPVAEYSRLTTWEQYLSSRSVVTFFLHYVIVYYTKNVQIFCYSFPSPFICIITV